MENEWSVDGIVVRFSKPCTPCSGAGRYKSIFGESECSVCHGSGRLQENRIIPVDEFFTSAQRVGVTLSNLYR